MTSDAHFLGQDGSQGLIWQQVAKEIKTGEYSVVRTSVAYVTEAAARSFINLSLPDEAPDIEFAWLVSIDFGRTEPGALAFLREQNQTEVRVANGSSIIERSSLTPRTVFHPKSAHLEPRSALGKPVLVVGSANLTASAMTTGIEHALLLHGDPQDSEAKSCVAFDSWFAWWNTAWDKATPATPELISAYAELRYNDWHCRGEQADAFEAASSSRLDGQTAEVNPDQFADWATARYFFIDAGRLSRNLGADRPGNQLDMPRGTRVFFGFTGEQVERNTVFGDRTLVFGSTEAPDRSLRFGNNQMDKINMPGPGSPFPNSWDDSCVLFERLGGGRFRVSVGAPDERRDWIRRAQAQGMHRQMGGGSSREYGFFN